MTHITRDEVLRLAAISNLQLSSEEIDSLEVDIEHIIAYVDQLNELDTSGVEPTYQVIDLENVWREDTAVTSDVCREQLLALAPASADNQIKVPKVL